MSASRSRDAVTRAPRPAAGVARSTASAPGRPDRASGSGAPGTVAAGPAARAALVIAWIAPVLVLPGVAQRWGWPTLLAAVFAVGLAVWAAPTGRLPRWFLVGLIVGGALFVTAALDSAAPLSALFGRAPRYEGLVVVPVLAAATWLGARLLGPRSSGDVYRVAMPAVSVASVALGSIALLEALGLRPIETDLVRPGSLAGNATDQGILGVVFAGILAHAVVGAWHRMGRIVWWPVAGLAGAVAAIVTSASRGALLAALAVGIAIAVRVVLTARRRLRATSVVLGVGAALLGILLVLPGVGPRLLGTDALAVQTIGDRLVIWRDALALAARHPWTGVGPSGYRDAVVGVYGDDWYRTVTPDRVLDSPHNILLQVLATGGVPLAAVFVALCAGVVVAGARAVRGASGARRDFLLAALTVLPAVGLALSTTPTSPKTLLPLAVLAGALVSRHAGAALAAPWRWGGTVLVTAWVLALAAWTVADAHLLTGMRAASEARFADAEAGFAAAAGLRPWDADIPLVATRAFGGALGDGRAGAADMAQAWASRAAERLPGSAEAQEAAGMVALELGHTDEAFARLENAFALSPANPRIAHEYGLAAFAAGHLDAAEAALARAVQLAPDSSASSAALAEVRSRLNP